MSGDPVVIVGASLAGARAAESVRRHGYTGQLVIVGAEVHRPYDRPPLSKRVLNGGADSEAAVRSATELSVSEDLDAHWRLGTRATGLDPQERRITLDDGSELGYCGAVLATGAAPRLLPGFEGLDTVHVVRTLDDGIRLRAALEARPRVVVIGAGFIGLEVAASCRARGLPVTVLEPQAAPLAHVLGPQLGEAIARLHRAGGVDLRLGVTVRGPAPDGRGVALDDDEVVDADVVVMGVGVVPVTDWLEGSGVDLDRGVVCDERLRVLADGRPVPALVAAGDVARWPDLRSGEQIRVEHWTNAADSGEAAGHTLVDPDHAEAYGPVPYVWSDQFGPKLQLVGLPRPDDEVHVVEGEPGEGRWLAAYGRDGRLVAAFGAGRPAGIMQLRRGIEEGAAFPPGG